VRWVNIERLYKKYKNKKRNQPYRSLIHDDRGIAYGIGIVAIFLVFVGVFYALFLSPTDEIISAFNNLVSIEPITEKTTDAFNFNILLFKSVPVIAILGVFLWGIVRALEKKEVG
jgi:hypothetical protein